MKSHRAVAAVSLLVLLLAGILLAAGCGSSGGAADTSPKSTSPEDTVPKGTGQAKLLYFTQSGWSACEIAEPIVNGLKPKYEGKVKFETISLDDPNNFKLYQKKYNLQGSPTVVVIDSSGTVVLNQAGIGDEAEYKNMVQSALDKASK